MERERERQRDREIKKGRVHGKEIEQETGRKDTASLWRVHLVKACPLLSMSVAVDNSGHDVKTFRANLRELTTACSKYLAIYGIFLLQFYTLLLRVLIHYSHILEHLVSRYPVYKHLSRPWATLTSQVEKPTRSPKPHTFSYNRSKSLSRVIRRFKHSRTSKNIHHCLAPNFGVVLNKLWLIGCFLELRNEHTFTLSLLLLLLLSSSLFFPFSGLPAISKLPCFIGPTLPGRAQPFLEPPLAVKKTNLYKNAIKNSYRMDPSAVLKTFFKNDCKCTLTGDHGGSKSPRLDCTLKHKTNTTTLYTL